jgi:glycosyltransferase involved in cell wall biosynthesis
MHFHVDLNKVMNGLKKTHNYKWPDIVWVNQKLSSVAGLYALADCMVLPSRAEGFSLTPFEAMVCKTPVIHTEFGGNLDFMNHDNSYLIDYVLREAPKEGQYHFYSPKALLAEPDIEHLKQLMRNVKNNPEQAKQKAEVAYNDVKDITWKYVADQILKLIKDRGWQL